MPGKPHKAAAFMVEAENSDRKNARVSDKLMLALPRELDGEQRAQLVRDFAEDVTEGRAPWLAAFHDRGKDAQNPHAHLVIRDRDPETGKRVAGLSEKGTTERLRQLWEHHANRALQSAGKKERIDRRTLQAQGIERQPTVHEGPKAQQMDRRGARARSRMRRYRNRPGARQSHREIDYEAIDRGRSRPDYNRRIQEETPADYWAAIDADRQARELDQLRLIHNPPASVDISFVAWSPVEKTHKWFMNEGRALFARFDKAKINSDKTQSIEEISDKTSNFSHNRRYHRLRKRSKGMADDRQIKKLQEKIASVEERIARQDSKFNRLLDLSYQDGTLAHSKMDAFLEKHGFQELLATIRADGNEFGPPPDDAISRDDVNKYRSELYVALADSWKLADQYQDMKTAVGKLQAQQSADATAATSATRAQISQQVQQEVNSKASTVPDSVQKQKTPAEIQAYLAAMKAKRAQQHAAERQKKISAGSQSEVEDEAEPN